MKTRFFKYLKEHRLFLSVMALGFIALAIQMINVTMYADDYVLGAISSKGIPGMIEHSVYHYFNWGGGYTPGMVITLLMLHPIVWKLLVVSLVSLFVSMTSRMVCKDDDKKRAMFATVLWTFFFGLSIFLTGETIYWLDGAMAYLFSSFQAFLVFYFLYTRMFMGDKKKYDVVLLPLFCFFGGWSSAQSGAVAVLIAIVFALYKQFFKKEKVSALCWTSVALTLIGFCIFYFAPGNGSRMGTFEEYAALSLPQKILYRAPSVFTLLFNGHDYDATALSVFVYLMIGLVSLLAIDKARVEKNRKIKVLSYICSGIGLLFTIGYVLTFIPIPKVSELMERVYRFRELYNVEINVKLLAGLASYALATLATCATIINAWILDWKNNKKPFITMAVVVSFAAEFIMVMSPYSPLRSAFYSVMFALCAIAALLYQCVEAKTRIFPIALIVLGCVNFYFALMYALFYVLYCCILKPKDKDKYRVDLLVFMITLGLYALANYGMMVYKYYVNKQIYDQNVERILEFKNSSPECEEVCVVFLVQPRYGEYGFTGFAGIDWIEEAVVDYYELPENVDFEYEEVTE